MTQSEPKKLITSGSSEDRDMVRIDSWKFKAKNPVIFYPENAPLTLKDVMSEKLLAKQISHSATRFSTSDEDSWASSSQRNHENTKQVWKNMSEFTPGLLASVQATPTNATHAFVASTPSLNPHEDFDPSELMTWGTIEGTPVLADSGSEITEKPQFRIPPTPKRELIGQKLADQAAKSIKQRAGHMSKSSGRRPNSNSLGNRLLSPAAHRLVSQSLQSKAAASPSIRSTNSSPFIFKSQPTPVTKRKIRTSATSSGPSSSL